MTLLRLLDVPHLEDGTARVELPPLKPNLLMFYLAVEGTWVPRETLAALFWPEEREGDARHNLRLLLSRARKLPWTAALETEAQRARFLIDSDVARFKAALSARRWTDALALHRKPLLSGVPAPRLPAFEAWLDAEREELQRGWRQAVHRHAEELTHAGAFVDAANLLRRMWRSEPLAEDLLQAYLRAALKAGQREPALRAYEAFAGELATELGLQPMADTQALAGELKSGRAQVTPLVAAAPRSSEWSTESLAPALVGRDAELEWLRQARIAVIRANPGVGKTRVLLAAAPEGVWLRCSDGLQGVPYHPVLAYLRSLPDLPDLGAYREDLAHLLPGAGAAPARAPSKGRLLEALARALEQSGADVVADDVQWADAATLELLVFLAQRPLSRLLIAYRQSEESPEVQQAIQSLLSAGGTLLDLTPLPLQDVGALLEDLLGAVPRHDEVAAWLHNRTGGNPLFVLETLRSLQDSGHLPALVSGAQAWSALEPRLPPRVVSVIQRRLSHLSAAARRTLEAASALGVARDARLLAGMAGLSADAVVAALAEAQARGFVRDGRFTHDVLREAVYAALPSAQRQLLHGRLLDTLAATGAANPAVLARHAHLAGRAEDEAHWALHAGHAALQVPAWQDAATLYRAAQHACASTGTGLNALRWRAFEGLGDALDFGTHYDESISAYQSAARLAPLEDRVSRARLQRKIGRVHTRAHAYEAAKAALHIALLTLGRPAAPNPEWWQEWIESQIERVMPYYYAQRGDAEELLNGLRDVEATISEHGTLSQQCRYLNALIVLENWRDRFIVPRETVELARTRLALAEQLNDRRELAEAQFELGFQWLWHGEPAQARVVLTQALETATGADDLFLQARSQTYLSIACRFLHDAPAVLEHSQAAQAQARTARLPEYEAVAEANLAWLAARDHNWPTVQTLGQAALRRWQEGAFGYVFHWLALLPLLHAALQARDAAQARQWAERLLNERQMQLPTALEAALLSALKQSGDTEQLRAFQAALAHASLP